MENTLKTITIRFPGGKNKVLTMSYDDGREEDRHLVEIFNKYGIKGTFHLNSGINENTRLVSPSEYKKLYEGHEISCHTYKHINMVQAPMEQIMAQVIEDRKALEAKAGYPVRGMSYPFGAYNTTIKDALKMLGIQYSRTVESDENFSMPKDFLEWHPTCHHEHKLLELAKKFKDIHNNYHLYMMYVWGHSYEFTDDAKWKVMEDFCSFISNQEDIWYATNIQIVDYMEAAGRLQFAADSSFVYNPSVQPVWIDVDNTIFEIPTGYQVQLF